MFSEETPSVMSGLLSRSLVLVAGSASEWADRVGDGGTRDEEDAPSEVASDTAETDLLRLARFALDGERKAGSLGDPEWPFKLSGSTVGVLASSV